MTFNADFDGGQDPERRKPRRRRPMSRAAARRKRRLRLEPLEDRRLLTVDVLPNNDIIWLGDKDGSTDDIFLVQRVNADPSKFELLLNGVSEGTYGPIGGNRILFVEGRQGDDALIVDSSDGLIQIESIRFDGGAGVDGVEWRQTGGSNHATTTLVIGALPGSGRHTTEPSDGSVNQVVQFENVEPLMDNLPAATFNITSLPGLASLLQDDNQINYEASPTLGSTWGRVTVDNFEPIEFTNKASLSIDAGAGSDAINLNHPSAPTALTSLTVDGGDPAASDTLIVNSVAGADDLTVIPASQGSGVVDHGAAVAIDAGYANVEHIRLVGQLADGDSMGVGGTFGSDLFEYFSGLTPDAGIVVGVAGTGFTLPTIDFLGMSPTLPRTFNVAGTQGGQDDFLFRGTFSDDQIAFDGSGLVTNAIDGTTIATIQVGTASAGGSTTGIVLEGDHGDDKFDITPESQVSVIVHGGNSSPDGDSLIYRSAGATTLELDTRDIEDAGSAGTRDASFSGIELVYLDANNNDLTVQATAGDDDVLAHPAEVDAVTIVVAGQPQIHATEIGTTFTVDPLGGDDTVTISGTATGDTIAVVRGASSTIQVTDATPTALQTVTIPTAGTETLVIAAGLGNDTVDVSGTGGPPLTVNGGGQDLADTLTITNTAATPDGNPTVVNPGNTPDAGTITTADTSVNTAFVGIESITLNGTAGLTDALLFRGTDDNDSITLGFQGGANRVWLNDRAVVSFSGFENIDLDGRFGDDKVNVSPDGLVGVLDIDVIGGDPTASDELVVNGTVGDDQSQFTPGSAIGAGQVDVDGAGAISPVDFTTIENVVINGQGGDDDLTVVTTNGDDTVTLTAGATVDSGSVQVNSLVRMTFVHLGSGGTLQIDDSAGGNNDVLIYNGSAAGDTFRVPSGIGTLPSTSVRLNSQIGVGTTGINVYTLRGLGGDDAFQITPQVALPINVQGDEPGNGSDVLDIRPGGGADVTVDLENDTVTETGLAPVSFVGVETVNIDAAAAAIPNLRVNGTTVDDELTYAPTSAASGTFRNQGDETTFHFMNLGAATVTFDDPAAGNNADHVVVEATNSHDHVAVDATARTVTVTDAGGTAYKAATLGSGIEVVTTRGKAGNDTFLVTPAPTVGAITRGNLQINVDGGPPGASDALVVATAAGAALPATDFVVDARSLEPGEGRVRVFRTTAGVPVAMPDVSYAGIEVVTANVAATSGIPQLLVLGPDASESNEFRTTATFLGSGETLHLDNLAIFPAAGEHAGVPADVDFFRVVAKDTGTLDFRVEFTQFATTLLPGGGQLEIDVLDAAGNVIAGATNGAFSGALGAPNPLPNTNIARIRIPAVAGQTYYVRVFGANVAAAAPVGQNTEVVNGYELAVTNEAPPVPYDLELNDIVQIGTVAAAPAPTTTIFAASLSPANPALAPPTIAGDYISKTVTFTSGVNNGRRATVTAFAGGVFTVGAGLIGTPAAGDTFLVETTDTGRSQLDNVTRDTTPIITFRLDDDRLLLDLPGNPTTNFPPDGAIPIPFVASQAAAPAATAGYRVPVFIEGTPGQAANLPQVPVGYARRIAAGVYVFDFGVDAIPGAAALPLADGSHFVRAKVEIIDPAAGPAANAYGYGARSQSLEIVVDTAGLGVSFGDPTVATDGLHPDSDTGNPAVPATLSDRITSDTTPTFWGQAEANALVRAYVDVDGTGTVTATDVLIGQTVAIPEDGTSQMPAGSWELTSTVNMNSPALLAALGVAVPDGVRTILVTAEDASGNVSVVAVASTLSIFVDTQGPQIFDPDGAGANQAIQITGSPTYNLFSQKPGNVNQGPTPAVNGLTIHVRDLPDRAAAFLYDALSNIPPLAPVVLQGDASGVIPITTITFTPTAPASGQPVSPVAGFPATGTINLAFAAPLPDDRYTLTLRDSLIDPSGNALDGENNAVEPNAAPSFPSGDGIPGGDFVARFTVDSRPEIGTACCSGVYVDINGNLVFDPEGRDGDVTNRDLVFQFGRTTDAIFGGKFHASGNAGSATAFDALGAFGLDPATGQYRFLLDLNRNGRVDAGEQFNSAYQGSALPVAGNFSGAAGSGDEIGLFTGTQWRLDTTGDNQLDLTINTSMRGLPLVGDFNGDGADDLATFDAGLNRFFFDTNRDGTADDTLDFGFPGMTERPVAGDMNLDGIDDLGLWVTDRSGQPPSEIAEWYLLVSDQAAALPSDVFDVYTPAPLGNDLFAQFGDRAALPLLANLDPPVDAVGESAPEQSDTQDTSSNASGTTTATSVSTTSGHTNLVNPLDVNADGRVAPQDVLIIINAIEAHDPMTPLLAASLTNGAPFLDVNADGLVSARDVLQIVNYLNSSSVVQGEGESVGLPLVISPATESASPAGASRTNSPAPVAERTPYAAPTVEQAWNESGITKDRVWEQYDGGEEVVELESILREIAEQVAMQWDNLGAVLAAPIP